MTTTAELEIRIHPNFVHRSGRWFVIFPDVVGSGEAISELVAQDQNVIVIAKSRWLSTTPLDGVAALVVAKSLDDVETLAAAIEELRIGFGLPAVAPFAEIASFSEGGVLVTARLRMRFCSGGLSLEESLCFRDKLQMKRRAACGGIPVPAFAAAHEPAEVEHLLRRSDTGKFVLKPRMGCANAGIEIHSGAGAVQARLAELGARPELLVEEFVDGDLFHVDCLMRAGEIAWELAFQCEHPPLALDASHGIQVIDLSPEPALIGRLTEFNRIVLREFGLKDGLSHTEIFCERSTGRLLLCESACRPPGAGVVVAHSALRGVSSFVSWARLCACGLPTDGGRPLSVAAAAMLTIIAPRGRVVRTDDLSQLNDPRILGSRMYARPGTELTGHGYLNALGTVVVQATDRAEARALVQDIGKRHSFEVEEIL